MLVAVAGRRLLCLGFPSPQHPGCRKSSKAGSHEKEVGTQRRLTLLLRNVSGAISTKGKDPPKSAPAGVIVVRNGGSIKKQKGSIDFWLEGTAALGRCDL